jgi:PadR family transcriptional regulator, regulatory protein PadR
MENPSLDLVRGTLDLLMLKTLTWGPLHGYAIVSAIKNSTDGALLVEEGALYPALYRMEAKGWVEAEWGLSSNNRRAKYYQMTALGRRTSAAKRVPGTPMPARLESCSRPRELNSKAQWEEADETNTSISFQ